ncbi:LysR substrate-binding domain-containing protein [Panacagrimonas perspica]|uniref:LysR substrate-binding domain-containing protein n=1 Tax=Panacagrimonas perspica TaxID=381431 RepID=UPI00105F371D
MIAQDGEAQIGGVAGLSRTCGCPPVTWRAREALDHQRPRGSTSDAWSFKNDGRTMSLRAEARVLASVDEGATAAALSGIGILSTRSLGCRPELESGTLVRVLADWTMDAAEVHAVFPAGRAAKPSARAFVDHLAHGLAR